MGTAVTTASMAAREIVVRFRDGSFPEWNDVAARVVVQRALGTPAPRFGLERVFSNSINKLAQRASEADPGYNRPAFGLAYFVMFSAGTSFLVLHGIRARLLADGDVATAEIAPHFAEPAVLPADDDSSWHQAYREGMVPDWYTYGAGSAVAREVRGTNAWYASRFPGGDGRRVRVIDIERSWKLDHADLVTFDPADPLVPVPIESVAGVNLADLKIKQHGTRTLGVLCARDNELGVVGLAPRVGRVKVASHERVTSAGVSVQRLEKTIEAAAAELRSGDVLLLEVERREIDDEGVVTQILPVESWSTVRDVIVAATARKIIVIEAAGNGGEWLGAGDRTDAIMVGAAFEYPPHKRRTASSHGPRIDCWAWGNRVTSCDVHRVTGLDQYTGLYDGTSSASAIIAGVAVVLQGAWKVRTGEVLTPRRMRRLLRKHGPHATEADGSRARMRRMPDVREIIDQRLKLPFPFVRDSEDDVGEPGIWLSEDSPDMALRAPGLGAGGLGAPPFANDPLGKGATAEFHVRVHNRAARDSGPLLIDAFWATPPLAATSWGWSHLADVHGIAVVDGHGYADAVVPVINPLPRAASNMSLMTVLRHDPDDERLDFRVRSLFPHRPWLDRLRSTAYRNTFTLAYQPTYDPELDAEVLDHEFGVPAGEGAVGDDADVRVESDLPADARLWIEVPRAVSDVVARAGLVHALDRADRDVAVFELPANELAELPTLEIPKQQVLPMRLLLGMPTPPRERDARLRAFLQRTPRPSRGVRWTITADAVDQRVPS